MILLIFPAILMMWKIDKGSERTRQGKATTVVYEKLDKWMQNSVVEIVKNLKEATLLVHIYDKGRGEHKSMEDLECRPWHHHLFS